MIEDQRIRQLNHSPPDENGDFVFYWMQQSQRASFNHALEYAAACANARGQGLVVGFGLTDGYPEANERHYAFMLQGLKEVSETLRRRGIQFIMMKGAPDDVALKLSGTASLVVCDRGYLRHQRRWRERVAQEAGKQVVQVEADVVVPVETVSTKEEYAARTIRPKIQRLLFDALGEPGEVRLKKSAWSLLIAGAEERLDAGNPDKILKDLALDRSVRPVSRFTGGTSEARRRLQLFLEERLESYDSSRSDASQLYVSELSPYLHFGQISPVEIVLAVRAAAIENTDNRRAYLDELIVQRELAMNFVYFNPDYDSFKCLSGWAQKTLQAHASDRRPARYTRAVLEKAATEDRYWNAAMQEMLKTGYMHNHMRMYWGKKILEWSDTPEGAYETTLYLNNKYFLDGRDPNSYANVAWIFGLHDRAWPERPVFGKVRYMNANGLKRKFDIEAYIRWVDSL